MTAILIVWMGLGSAQTLSVSPFPDLATCEKARIVMASNMEEKSGWSNIGLGKTACLPL